MKNIIHTITFIISITSLNKAFANDNAYSKKWLKALHYKKTLFGYQSEVQGGKFFLHKDGRDNPLLEYQEFKKQLLNDKRIRCDYPLRSKILYNLLKLPAQYNDYSHCKKYMEYVLSSYPDNVYIVFSSYFMESPGSAFGHTFFRFERKGGGELLDVGINYGAKVTTDNSLLYTYYGITGGFNGSFASLPYFYKIREYNDFESRDLWSYKISLSQEERIKLVDHLWEIDKAQMPYYFFTKNCSYILLSVLDVVNESFDFTGKLPFYVIPIDTVKVIKDNSDLIVETQYRASIKEVFDSSYNKLNKKQIEKLDEYIKSEFDNNVFKDAKDDDALTLDAAMNYIDYKFSEDILRETGEIYKKKNNLLIKRSELKSLKQKEVKKPLSESPVNSHPSNRLILNYGKDYDNRTINTLNFRFALHDDIDPVQASPKYANLTFFNIDFHYRTFDNMLEVNSLELFNVETMSPWSFNHYPLSFKAVVAYNTDYSNYCTDCKRADIDLGTGISLELTDSLIFSTFTELQLAYSESYDESPYKEDLGLSAKLLYRTNTNFNILLRYIRQYSFSRELYQYETKLKLRYTLYNDLSFYGELNDFDDNRNSYKLGLLFYF